MTSSPQSTPSLNEQRAAMRRRVREAKLAAKALAVWLDPTLAGQEIPLAAAGDRWLARLGESNVRKLTMRMRRMADWEMVRAEKMREGGASAWTLLKFVGANQDMVIDGPACRDTIYSEVMQYQLKRKRDKGRETLIKAAIPLAVVATVAMAVSAGVGYVATMAAPHIGLDPQFAGECWNNWKTIFHPVLHKAHEMVKDFDVVSGGFMFALGAFWMWAHDSRIGEDLRLKAGQKEVAPLEQGIGFAAKSHRIQAAIRAIPEHQRILLAHFSSTDLRAFLLSPDEERIHMLRENRPPLLAQIKSILAQYPRSVGGLVPAVRDIADVCLPKRWARAIGARHPGEIDSKMMAKWRAPRANATQGAAMPPTGAPASVPSPQGLILRNTTLAPTP